MSNDNTCPPTSEAVPPIATDGMTTAEKIYTALVIVCAMFLLVSIATFHFIVIPRSPEPNIFYFVTAVLWMVVLLIAVTSGINLYYRSLLIVPTIIQCVTVSIMIYFSPLGIWGGYLLYRRIQRSKTSPNLATVN